MIDQTFRDAFVPKSREGKLQENGLQAHLRVVHGYGLTRLAALSVIKLVFLHQQNADGHPK